MSVSAVTVADVYVSAGRPSPDLGTIPYLQASQWIDDAETIIRARLGNPADLDADVLAYVVREAVALKVKVPDPTTRREVAVDDGRVSMYYERATGQVTILDEWWTMLAPDNYSTGAFTITPAWSAE